MFDQKAIDQIENHGLDTKTVEEQIKNFKNGFPFTKLHRAAAIGDGILRVSPDEIQDLSNRYDNAISNRTLVKFVPASGAASRMFKLLFEFMESYDGSDEAYQNLISDQSEGSVFEFFKRLEDFAFYDDLANAYQTSGMSLSEAHVSRKYVEILEFLLTEKGLDYGNLPKGLLAFHKYSDATRTPIEEHIVEGAQYANSKGNVKLHFTLSPEHIAKFHQHIDSVRGKYEKEYAVHLEITHSIQKPSTDTIAVDPENELFYGKDGNLLFRPAGHGALLENLNDIDADVIFLKNIDNVVPDRLKPDTIAYKKVIGAKVLDIQKKVFQHLKELDSGTADKDQIITFIKNHLGYHPTGSMTEKDLHDILNRPIRICGMVKNEGKAGGGPFWVSSDDGSSSLQVVESAQVDLENSEQHKIFNESTHFNPVDVVCCVKDYKGQKFDLLKFRDPSTGFITKKSKNGKDLKAQELPGLWNGSMAYWNTLFVEVPLITFNPVKAVNDLLKEEHQ